VLRLGEVPGRTVGKASTGIRLLLQLRFDVRYFGIATVLGAFLAV
jgi:hypothetical protein